MSLEKAENMLMELGCVDISQEAWPFHCGEGMESGMEAQGGEIFLSLYNISDRIPSRRCAQWGFKGGM